MAFGANFGVIDDHTLVETLLRGEIIPFFIQPSIGRFYPLDGQELNLLSLIFAPNAAVFYTFNALCVLIVIGALRYALRVLLPIILQQDTESTHLNFAQISSAQANFTQACTESTRPNKLHFVIDITLLVLLFSPAFATAWLRLFVPERMEFVFLSLFMLSYAFVWDCKYAHRATLQNLAFIMSLICANIALYYKETAFAMVFAFGFGMAVCGWKSQSARLKGLHIGLMLSALVWFVVYCAIMFAYKDTSGRYGETHYESWLVILKMGFMGLCHEPFLYGLTFGALFYRIYALFVRKKGFNPLLDSAILASCTLLLEYFVLRLGGSLHYCLPAYIFGLVVIAYCFYNWWQILYGKIWLIVLLCFFVGNSMFAFIYHFAHYKFVPNNFQATLQFMSDYTHKYPNTRIFLEGVDRVNGVEVYVSFDRWLRFYGASDYDFFSDKVPDVRVQGRGDENARLSVFKNDVSIPKHSGDIVIVTPFSENNFDTPALLSEADVIFEADYGYNVPLFGIKSWLKKLLTSFGLARGDSVISHNLYSLPLHFYVLRVR